VSLRTLLRCWCFGLWLYEWTYPSTTVVMSIIMSLIRKLVVLWACMYPSWYTRHRGQANTAYSSKNYFSVSHARKGVDGEEWVGTGYRKIGRHNEQSTHHNLIGWTRVNLSDINLAGRKKVLNMKIASEYRSRNEPQYRSFFVWMRQSRTIISNLQNEREIPWTTHFRCTDRKPDRPCWWLTLQASTFSFL